MSFKRGGRMRREFTGEMAGTPWALTHEFGSSCAAIFPPDKQLRFYGIMSSPGIKNISLYRNSDLHYISPVPCPEEGRCASHVSLGAGCDGRRLAFG
jgi:hypothetical protein